MTNVDFFQSNTEYSYRGTLISTTVFLSHSKKKKGKAIANPLLFKIVINMVLCTSYCHFLNTAGKSFRVTIKTYMLWWAHIGRNCTRPESTSIFLLVPLQLSSGTK